ncbi:MAG: inverse autotransporter beta domain-containing protein [Desulfomonile tiedjei]|nr:inverse autotransporter beta domain-containing protein [Desulfomonile tiedjei]
MLVGRGTRDKHESGVPVCAMLTAVFVIVQASTAPAQLFQPQFSRGDYPALATLLVPHNDAWSARASSSLFPPLHEIKSIKNQAAKSAVPTEPIRNPLLPTNANLETVYLHTFDQTRNYGRWTVDYVIPLRTGKNGMRFMEIHGEFEKPYFSYSGQLADRADLSLGLGQRLFNQKNFLVGANAFLDASQVRDQWYWSGGLGLEAALRLFPNGSGQFPYPFEVLDVSFNVYKGGGLDLEAGFSMPLGDYVDLRFNAAKYRFYDGEYLLGWRGGADLKASGGLFVLKYEYGQDRINSSYHTVGAFVSVPLELENLLQGKWPFKIPDSFLKRRPDFQRLAASRVTRSWRHPQTVVEARPSLGFWEAPGAVRWDVGQDFSPTECYWQGTDKTEKNPGNYLLIGGHSLGDYVYVVVIGAVEYAYRWMFGPYKSLPPEKTDRLDSLAGIK